MPSATITITDSTKAALDLLTLLTSSTTPGYSVVPAAGFQALTTLGRVSYLSIQASPRNGNGTYIYRGDKDTDGGGNRQGKELTPGTIDVMQGIYGEVHLSQVYIRGSSNGLIANVEWYYA